MDTINGKGWLVKVIYLGKQKLKANKKETHNFWFSFFVCLLRFLWFFLFVLGFLAKAKTKLCIWIVGCTEGLGITSMVISGCSFLWLVGNEGLVVVVVVVVVIVPHSCISY